MKKAYVCGDREYFATMEKAVSHAEDVFQKEGIVISIRELEAPYPWCRHPEICCPKGYCPHDPNCGD